MRSLRVNVTFVLLRLVGEIGCRSRFKQELLSFLPEAVADDGAAHRLSVKELTDLRTSVFLCVERQLGDVPGIFKSHSRQSGRCRPPRRREARGGATAGGAGEGGQPSPRPGPASEEEPEAETATVVAGDTADPGHLDEQETCKGQQPSEETCKGQQLPEAEGSSLGLETGQQFPAGNTLDTAEAQEEWEVREQHTFLTVAARRRAPPRTASAPPAPRR